MKNLIKLMLLLLIGLTISVSLFSMSSKLPSKKESLNIQDTEILTCQNFAELDEEGLDKKTIFNNGLGDLYFKLGQYFDYGKAIFLYSNETFEQKVKGYRKQAVEYYLKAKKYYEKAANSKSNIEIINLIKLSKDQNNQQEHSFLDPIYQLAAWANANYQLGGIYHNGFGLEKPDYNKAIEHYEKAAMINVQDYDLSTWPTAYNSIINSVAYSNFNIGIIYYTRKLGEPDNKKAKLYWEKVAIPEVKNSDLNIWARAVSNLAAVADIIDSKKYYETLITDDIKKNDLAIWANANVNLGNIYYNGKLEAPDYQRAKECYEKVVIPEVKIAHLNAWTNANTLLGDIYYHGYLGVPDYQKAKEYYTKVATPEVKNVNLNTWKHASNKLKELEKIEKEESDKSELVN